MPTQRLTISMPADLYQELRTLVPMGEISQFATRVFREYIQTLKLRKKETPVDRVLRLRDEGPKYTSQQLQDSIDRGRP